VLIAVGLTAILVVAALAVVTLALWRSRRTKLAASGENLPLTSRKPSVQNK
jgi:hypothetical protein